MRNDQTKHAFAQGYSQKATTQKLILSIFNALSVYEEEYGVDFAMFDDAQTHTAVNAVAGFRTNNAVSILRILKEYVKWCKSQGISTSDSVFSVKIDAVEKYRRGMVGNPQHLAMSLDAAFPHPESNEIEYIYRSFLWLAFLGLDDNEAIYIRQDEVDFSSMKIRISGNGAQYPIYPESLIDLRKAVELKQFREPRGKGVYKDRASGDYILRGKLPDRPMDEMLVRTLRPMISRAFKSAQMAYEESASSVPDGLSLRLSYKHIYMSGVFYRAYEKERIGIPVSFADVVDHETRSMREDDPRFQAGRNYTLNKHKNAMARGYEEDYKCWKAAFSPT